MKRSALAGLLALSASVAFAQDTATPPSDESAPETAQTDICQALLAYVTAPPPAVRRAAPAASASEADPDAPGAGGPSEAPGAAAPASAAANLNLPGEQPAPDASEAAPAPGAPAGNAGGDSPGPVDPSGPSSGPAPAEAANQPAPPAPAGMAGAASANPTGAEAAATPPPPPPPPPLDLAWIVPVEEAQQLAETGDQMACRSKVRELRLAGLPIPAQLALTDVIATEGKAPGAGAE